MPMIPTDPPEVAVRGSEPDVVEASRAADLELDLHLAAGAGLDRPPLRHEEPVEIGCEEDLRVGAPEEVVDLGSRRGFWTKV